MPNRQEFVEAARARDVPQEAVDEILRCLRPCVLVNKDGKGEPAGWWHGEDETAIVLDCAALPGDHLDLGLGISTTGSLLLDHGFTPRWRPATPTRDTGRGQQRREEDSGVLHARAAWTYAEWWSSSGDALHPGDGHPALDEAIAEYERHLGPVEVVDPSLVPADLCLQLGGSLLRMPQDPPELALIGLDDDWNWEFTEEVRRKASAWKLFAQLHLPCDLESYWLVHEDDRTVERWDRVVWTEQGD
ncbi:hypothetical protein [Streptomyces sp. NPDC088812]|uniref:hypothetical protein n=1 Tax=Streptomyces sp. NPDC088812 TaxID=3365905 RepID=UPI0037F831CB